jgi:hypothetical protein
MKDRTGATMSVAMANVPIQTAAQSTGIDADLLTHLVNAGAVPGQIAPNKEGWCDFESAQEIAAKLQSAYEPVEGRGILATDAAEKYGFTAQTIYQWVKMGWVSTIIQRPRNRLLNEGDIALARGIADLIGQARGKAIFPAKPRSGRPKKPTN